MSAGRTLEGAGSITWWGFGPARDLLNTGLTRKQGERNVLLIGSSDPRHILKTISGLEDTESVHLWVMENSMDMVARQMLLLYISLSDPKDMSMQEKTEVFLELFGNSEIRSQTDAKLKDIAAQLSLSITDSVDTDTPTHSCLDTHLLKFRERDALVQIFTQWRRHPSAPFSMPKAWDARVRQHLGTRYDARRGCFDWDLTMKLHERGCGVIHKQQYTRWRESGVAFELREGLYSNTNQCLLSTRVFNRRGDKVGVRGYWGDIVSSPYLSFGIETEDKELLKTQNNLHLKTAQDISIVNVQMLFESLSRRGRDTHVSQLDNDTVAMGSCRETQTKEQKHLSHQSGEPQGSVGRATEGSSREAGSQLLRLKGVNVSFLSPDSLPELSKKSRYHRLFNTIYSSASMVHHLGSSLTQTAAPDCVLMVELAKYLLDLSKEQEAAFSTSVSEIAKEMGFVPVHPQDGTYAVFRLQP